MSKTHTMQEIKNWFQELQNSADEQLEGGFFFGQGMLWRLFW